MLYNVPFSPGNGSTTYQTERELDSSKYQPVQEIELQFTKQSWKGVCNLPKSPGHGTTLYRS